MSAIPWLPSFTHSESVTDAASDAHALATFAGVCVITETWSMLVDATTPLPDPEYKTRTSRIELMSRP
ncbi:MAG TPA: hypothetical protein VHV79_13125 [Mycobacteriales bacterium]|nr:hypothetical protein [Mycobacteriales bacterium]